MKKPGPMICAFIAVCFFTALAGAQSVPVPRYYGIQSGIVQYEISGDAKGTEVLSFDQWGMRQTRVRTIETLKYGVVHTNTFFIGSSVTMVDPDKNLGRKFEDETLKKLITAWTPEDPALLSLKVLEISAGKKLRDEKVLERVCEVWRLEEDKTTLWLYNGLALKMEVTTPDGVMVYQASKITEGALLDDGVFKVPGSVNFIDVDINSILISRKVE